MVATAFSLEFLDEMASANDFDVYEDAHPLGKSCSNLETLRKHEDFKDLAIQVKNGDPVLAQRIVLAARIPFLRKLVNGSPLRWDREHVDNECAECIVSYAYTGRLKVTMENASKVVSFSKILELYQIVNFCTNFISKRLDLDNLSLFWNLSKDNDLVTLRERCTDFMREQFENFITKSLFIKLDFGDLKSLILSDELGVCDEEFVFGAIKSWIQADDKKDQEKELHELMKCIRWSETSSDFRKSLAESDEMVERSPSCLKYLLNVEHNISNPRGLFNATPRSTQQKILTFGEPSSGEREWIVESFYPATERSTRLARLTYRRGAAVASVGGGKVMISGGEVDGKASSSVEMFSCPEKQSRPVASLNVARLCHGACAVGDAVVVCGGGDEVWIPLNSCEVYSPYRWRPLPAMKGAREGVAVVSSPDRRVFAIGGWMGGCLSSVEVCRLPDDFATSPPPAEGFWMSLVPMREARYGPAAVLFQGHLLVAGGCGREENLSSVEMLPVDQEEAQWVSLPAPMKVKRYFFSLVVSSRGIFAFGNIEQISLRVDDLCTTRSVERLKVPTNRSTVATSASNSVADEISAAQWESLSPINSMKRVHGAVLI